MDGWKRAKEHEHWGGGRSEGRSSEIERAGDLAERGEGGLRGLNEEDGGMRRRFSTIPVDFCLRP